MPDEKKLQPPEAGPDAPAELNELLRESYFACLADKGKTDEAAQKECADVAWEKAKEKYEEAEGEWTLKAEARFRKEIIRVGRYVLPDDPGKTVDVTLERLREWVNDTRAAGVKTWVPYHHSYHPADNAGWVEAFEMPTASSTASSTSPTRAPRRKSWTAPSRTYPSAWGRCSRPAAAASTRSSATSP